MRGDPEAGTTLAPIHDLLPLLRPARIATLRQPRFRVAVDGQLPSAAARAGWARRAR